MNITFFTVLSLVVSSAVASNGSAAKDTNNELEKELDELKYVMEDLKKTEDILIDNHESAIVHVHIRGSCKKHGEECGTDNKWIEDLFSENTGCWENAVSSNECDSGWKSSDCCPEVPCIGRLYNANMHGAPWHCMKKMTSCAKKDANCFTDRECCSKECSHGWGGFNPVKWCE